MSLRLDALTDDECGVVREWRHAAMSGLRTPYFLTHEMQLDFYRTVVCNRAAPHRYYAIRDRLAFVGMGGLTNIQWENGLAEISLITDPKLSGYGEPSVRLLLDEAFHRLRLRTVFGECYRSNPAVGFWETMAQRLGAQTAELTDRKFWDGAYHNSFYFSFRSPRPT